MMKRFFLSLKMERVWQNDCANYLEVMNDIADYIVGYLRSHRAALKTGQLVTQRFRA